MSPIVLVDSAPINVSVESDAIHRAVAGEAGAIVCFSGTVRGGEVRAMTLEHYPGMTEQALQEIARNAIRRWSLLTIRIRHRVGRMMPGEIIVFTGVAASHRGEAFDACAYIMDCLKTQAPFWKKEETADGERWVDVRSSDTIARERWEK